MEADIDLFEIALDLENGRSESFICEGCNNRAVYKDEEGLLYLAREINREMFLIPVQLSELMP